MSRTAVVILNYNGEKLLDKFLPSVLTHSGSAEVIVADNGSTDKSIELLRARYPQVKLILLDKNYGFCGGYNRALKQVSADYYVLLNSDVEVTPGWLDPIINLLDTHPDIGAVQPKILSYEQRNLFEYAGAGGGLIDSLGYPFCRGRILASVEEDKGQYDDIIPIFWATGACLIVRANLYHQFGGLDEDFFAHMEEIDLCWKLHRMGARVYYCGQSKVYHLGAGTLGYASPRKTFLNFRNGLVLISKHFDTWEMLIKLPLRIILDWIAAVVFVLKGEFKHSSAILKAHSEFISTLPSTLQKRRVLRTQFPHYGREGIFEGSIVLAYYFLGRKHYKSDLKNPK